MIQIALTDSQWAFILPLLPPLARIGRQHRDDRLTLEGALYVLITGRPWQEASATCAPGAVCTRHLRYDE
jgi:transposase